MVVTARSEGPETYLKIWMPRILEVPDGRYVMMMGRVQRRRRNRFTYMLADDF